MTNISPSERFTPAVDYARIAHSPQLHKGSNTPYLFHPLAVASLVMEFGGSEDQVIAGLLHDVIEDCGLMHESLIRAQFGGAVADIVVGCSDSSAEQKSKTDDAQTQELAWQARKQA